MNLQMQDAATQDRRAFIDNPQAYGRALRHHVPNRSAIILDHDPKIAPQDREWTLDGRKKRSKHAPRPESAWWWAVAVVALLLFVMLAAYVGPVVFAR